MIVLSKENLNVRAIMPLFVALFSILQGCTTAKDWNYHGNCLSSSPTITPCCSAISNASKVQKKVNLKTNDSGVQFIGRVTASFYHDSLSYRKTATGELYDPVAFTAASRTLPFGTLLIVKRPSNGSYVVVRVNDRGPYIEGRSIDLSRAAAEKLGMINDGLSFVDLYVVPHKSTLASTL